MRRYLAAFLIAGAVVTVPATAAFAAKPAPVHAPIPAIPAVAPPLATPTTNMSKVPTVMFVLHGTLGGVTPATATVAGSMSMTVTSSNFEQKTLKGTTLTFGTSAGSAVAVVKGQTMASGDRVLVKIRAPKNADAAVLESKTPVQVVNFGRARASQ